jgi:FtsH-binding integral membrane protein
MRSSKVSYVIHTNWCSVLTLTAMNFLGTSFTLLTFEKGMRFASSMYYFVFVGCVCGFFMWQGLGISKKAHKLELREKELKEGKETKKDK